MIESVKRDVAIAREQSSIVAYVSMLVSELANDILNCMRWAIYHLSIIRLCKLQAYGTHL